MRIRKCRLGLRGMILSRADGCLIKRNRMSRRLELWMPLVPELDLYWLGQDGRLIRKEEAEPIGWKPRTWRLYSCEGAEYCLEMRKGKKITAKDIEEMKKQAGKQF